jgi:hypothetical protein
MHVQDFMENNGEAIIHDMINTSGEDGEGDYTQAEPEPNQHAYDIGAEPLFLNISMSTDEGLTAVALAASLASSLVDGKRISQRTMSYTPTEDRVLWVLCQAWMEISPDTICSADQKEFNYWRKVGNFFHEQRKLCEKPFQSDRSDLSLSKRWGTIHARCSKFQGSSEKIQKRHISRLSAVDMVKSIPSLSMFFLLMH